MSTPASAPHLTARWKAPDTLALTLTGDWRTDGAKLLKGGEARLTKTGKSPASDPQNIASTLSELTTEFSHSLAQAIREVSPQ